MLHTNTDDNHTYTNHSHNNGAVMAGFAGILAGAVGVTALALSDKDIRKKVKVRAKVLKKALQDWSAEKLHMIDHHRLQSVDTVEKTEIVDDETKEDEPLKHVAMKN